MQVPDLIDIRNYFSQMALVKSSELFELLEKYGEKISSNDYVNLEYLNSYYQKFGNILPKSERGKFPRPTVNQTIKYRSFIEEKIISFLKKVQSSNRLSEELRYDILLANQHEMQHQELMIYDSGRGIRQMWFSTTNSVCGPLL